MNLKLPEIPYSAGVPGSAAPAIERAGAKFSEAAGQAANVLSDMDKHEIQTQAQEASLQATRGINDTLTTIKNQPYMKPEQVRAVFGGNVPEGVRLTETVTAPDGTQTEQDREIIATHEFVPQLFEQQAKAAIANAGQAIKESPWRAKWQEAVAADVEHARTEALDWQRAQRVADLEVRTEVQSQQAASSRNWNAFAVIAANSPTNAQREKLMGELPRLKTKATVEDALRSGDPAVLTDLQAKIAANDFPDAKLSAEEQAHFTAVAHARKKEILADAEHAEKKAYEQKFGAQFSQASQALVLARQTGQPLSRFYSVAQIASAGLRPADAENLISFLDKNSKPEERKTNNAAWATLVNIDAKHGLEKMSLPELLPYLGQLSDEHQRHWMGEWQKAQEKAGKAPAFSDADNAHIDAAVKAFGFDPKKGDGTDFQVAKSLAQQNLILWRQRNPDKLLTFGAAYSELGLSTFNAKNNPFIGSGSAKSWFKDNLSDMGTVTVLAEGLHALHPGQPVTALEVQAQAKAMKEEAPFVTEAWSQINPREDTPLTEANRAVVRSMLMNPVEAAKIDAQLRAEGKPVNPRSRVYRAVLNLQPPENREAAAKVEQQMQETARQKQVSAAGAEDRATREAIIAEDAKSAQMQKEAFLKLPEWERGAVTGGAKQFQGDEEARQEQIRARVYAEDYARQQARKASGEVAFTTGKRYADDPIRIEMDKRVAAEAAVGRAERRASFDAQMKAARDSYRVYFEREMVNDDGSQKLFAPAGFMTFPQWLEKNAPSSLVAGGR